jgi:hypothetical protein
LRHAPTIEARDRFHETSPPVLSDTGQTENQIARIFSLGSYHPEVGSCSFRRNSATGF